MAKLVTLPKCEDGRCPKTAQFYIGDGVELYSCNLCADLKHGELERIPLGDVERIDYYLKLVSEILNDITAYKKKFSSKKAWAYLHQDLTHFEEVVSQVVRRLEEIQTESKWKELQSVEQMVKKAYAELIASKLFNKFNVYKYADGLTMGIRGPMVEKLMIDSTIQVEVAKRTRELSGRLIEDVKEAQIETERRIATEHYAKKEEMKKEHQAVTEKLTKENDEIKEERKQLQQQVEQQKEMLDQQIQKLNEKSEELSDLNRQHNDLLTDITLRKNEWEMTEKMLNDQIHAKQTLVNENKERNDQMIEYCQKVIGKTDQLQTDLNEVRENTQSIPKDSQLLTMVETGVRGVMGAMPVEEIYREVYGEHKVFDGQAELTLCLSNSKDRQFVTKMKGLRLPKLKVLQIYYIYKFDKEEVEELLSNLTHVSYHFDINVGSLCDERKKHYLHILLQVAPRIHNQVQLRWFKFGKEDLEQTLAHFKHSPTLHLDDCEYSVSSDLEFGDSLNHSQIHTLLLQNPYGGETQVKGVFEYLVVGLSKAGVKDTLKNIKIENCCESGEYYQNILDQHGLESVKAELDNC